MKRKMFFAVLFGSAALVACSDKQEANDQNIGAAVSQYLSQHGELCLSYRFSWPTDVSEQDIKNGHMGFMGVKIPQLQALEKAGLVTVSDAEDDGRDGTISPTPTGQKLKVRRYVLSDAGKNAYRELKADAIDKNGMKVSQGNLCYGTKQLAQVLKWELKPGDDHAASVSYLYKTDGLADWAGNADFQAAYPDFKKNIDGAGKTVQTLELTRTADGWESK